MRRSGVDTTVWIMGGNRAVSQRSPKFDFNVWYDPWAAKAVFDSDLDLKVFSYELCRLYRSDAELHSQILNLKSNGFQDLFINDFDELTRQHGTNMPLCDQLVALAYLFPDIIQETELVSMEVSLQDGPLFGTSKAKKSLEANVSLTAKINAVSLQGKLSSAVQRMADLPMRSHVGVFITSNLYRTDIPSN